MTGADNNQPQPSPPLKAEMVAQAQEAKQNSDWQLALQLWNKCIQSYDDGNQPWWHAEYAYTLLELEYYEEAEQKFNKLTLDFPQFEGGYVGLARLATKRCDWQLAVSCWDTCIRLFDDGDHPWWLANYANALSETAQYQQASDIYRQLTHTFPEFQAGFGGQAGVAQKQQDWKLAANLWKNCILKFGTDNPWWLRACTHALIELNQLHEALTMLGQIASLHANDLHTLELFCRIHFLLDDLPQCLQSASKLISHFPNSPRGYYWKEQVLIKLGHFDEAADCHLSWPSEEHNSQQQADLPDNYPADLILPPLKGNGNDYSFIEEKLKKFQETDGQLTLALSIVIPVYNRADMLAKTLAALVHQSYANDLIEVIIADDGSSDHILRVVEKYKKYLDLHYVRQEDQGYRLSAVRNLGIKAASHDSIFILDCDVIPARKFIEAGMNFFHVTQNAVLFGMRKYVCAESYTDDDLLQNPQLIEQLPEVNTANHIADWRTVDGRSHDWRIPLLIETDNLKEAIFPSLLFSGGIVAFPKEAIASIGYFDEEFAHWGGEDTEFGYRLYNQGYYFIPIPEVISFHQESSELTPQSQVDRDAGLEITKPILRQKCPLPSIRKYDPNSEYQVPKVSIYIPAYNVGDFITDAVDSVLNQTFTDLEIIICDDGSTDNTLDILQGHYSQEPRVHWVSQPHQGIAAASNRAVGLCRGMYIGQLDGDDMLEPRAVEVMANFLDNNNVGAIYSQYSWVDRTGSFMRKQASVDFSREHLLVVMICTAFRMFRKRDWLRTPGFDEALENAVDYDMMLKLSEVCTIAHLPQLTYKYRYHGKNTSLLNYTMQEKNHLIAIKKALQRMGLSEHWHVTAGSAISPRKVKFMKH